MERVLIVDDEPGVVEFVARRLEREGLHALAAGSAPEALELLEQDEFDLVVSDLQLPGMSGLDLVRRCKERDPLVQVVIMTGDTAVENAVQALRLHADDYLVKPFDAPQLVHAARRALEHRRLLLENRDYRLTLEGRVRVQARRLEQVYLASIRSLVNALEAKDSYTRGHSERVAEFAVALGRLVGGVDLDALRMGAQLHDIGKIGVDNGLLDKNGPLTTEERDRLRLHPLIGVRILSPMLEHSPTILDVVRHHHERWDGRGYPAGLAGAAIPLAARITAVADTMDAMTSRRPYRQACSWAATAAEIARQAGAQFDPRIADAARTVIDAGLALPEAS